VSDEFQPALEPDDQREIIKIAYRKRGWDEYRIVSQSQAMADPTPFFQLWDIDAEAQQKVIAFMAGLTTMTEAEIDELDNISMHEFLSGKDVPYELYSYLAFHANASLAEPIDLVAASEQIRIMRHMMLQGGGGQYKGGFVTLAKVMLREFEKNGGTLIRNNRVEKIQVEDGVVTGVVTTEGTFRAPIVVSSAGLQPTVLKLVGQEHFDRSYLNYIKGLVPGWAFTSVRYFLEKPVMDVAMYVAYADESWIDMERYSRMREGHIPEEVILFMVNHSFYDENAAPPGKQVLVSGTICSPDPDAKEIEGLWRVMDEQMQRFFPEIWAATERQRTARAGGRVRRTGPGGGTMRQAQALGGCADPGTVLRGRGRRRSRDGHPPGRPVGHRGSATGHSRVQPAKKDEVGCQYAMDTDQGRARSRPGVDRDSGGAHGGHRRAE
jgi:phytoene dehydrogenase-like protein